jgi:hypothetical protein
MTNGKPTNNDIYQLVAETLPAMERRLNAKIDAVKDDVADLKTKQAVSATKIGALVSGLALVVSTSVTVFVNGITGKK